jgi:sugar lactone lactonase YvrE
MADKVELLLDAKSVLGEGAIWHGKTQTLYWVDILQSLVHIYDPATGRDRTINVGEHVGTVVVRKSGGLMLALKHGFASLDLKTEKVSLIVDPEKKPENRFNDGKCDPAGRFWAGTLNYKDAPDVGALYRLDADLKAHRVVDRVTCSNGIVWSSDARTMYYIDSPTMRVDAFDFDLESGKVSNRRTVITVAQGQGFPDGMAIDAEDKLWVAHWDGNSVKRWDPKSGKLLRTIEIPATRVTSCAFGGPKLDQLYVTSATTGMDAATLTRYPHAGGLFRVDPGIQGLPSAEFAG